MAKCQRTPTTFSKKLKSFLGHLEGTQKASHTIRNYRLDLLSFERFLNQNPKARISLQTLTQRELELFHASLKEEGLKANTRRRKILTVRRFLRYLSQRKQMATLEGQKLPTPDRIERIPLTLDSTLLADLARALPMETVLERRNRLLLWTLTETGCLVSEVCAVRGEDWAEDGAAGPRLRIGGKNPRDVPVSAELLLAARQLAEEVALSSRDRGWMFVGFNKFGPLGGAISVRGVELLVRAMAERWKLDKLTPRIYRHSAVLHWHRQGRTHDEIRSRLGLRSDYAFRSYELLFDKKPPEPAAHGGTPGGS